MSHIKAFNMVSVLAMLSIAAVQSLSLGGSRSEKATELDASLEFMLYPKVRVNDTGLQDGDVYGADQDGWGRTEREVLQLIKCPGYTKQVCVQMKYMLKEIYKTTYYAAQALFQFTGEGKISRRAELMYEDFYDVTPNGDCLAVDDQGYVWMDRRRCDTDSDVYTWKVKFVSVENGRHFFQLVAGNSNDGTNVHHGKCLGSNHLTPTTPFTQGTPNLNMYVRVENCTTDDKFSWYSRDESFDRWNAYDHLKCIKPDGYNSDCTGRATMPIMMYELTAENVPQSLAVQSGGSSSSSSAAKGDPHLVNIKGEAFDVMQTGNMMLLEIPRGSSPATLDLALHADIEHLGLVQCGPTFITRASITGRWMSVPVEIRSGPIAKIGIQSKYTFAIRVDGKDWLPHAEMHRTLELSKDATITAQNRMFLFQVRGLDIAVSQPKRPRIFLDIQVKGLGNLKMEIGGLLGIDDHSSVEALPSACEMSASSLSLAALQEEEALYWSARALL